MKHNSVGKEIFRNLWGNAVEAYIFYDQVFIGVSGGSSIDNIRGSGTRLKLFRFDLRAGYNFKAIHHINIQPYFAMSRTLLHVTQTGENSPECKGIALGLNMNKTFKLSTMKYFFVFVDGSFNKVNYEPVDVMKMGYFLIKMGIGYKQLFLKRASPAAIGYSIPH